MRSKQAYCSARDQEVRVAWPDAPLHPGQAMAAEPADAVCLDLGERCTGELCPTFRKPRVDMAVRLARAGLDEPGSLRRRSAECTGCGRFVELKVVDPGYGWCPECNTVQPLAVSEAEESARLAGA